MDQCAAFSFTPPLTSIKNRYAESTQITFAQPGSQQIQSNGRKAATLTETFQGLNDPVDRNGFHGTLRAYLNSWRWRKCATGSCSSYVDRITFSNPLRDPLVSTLEAYLRIPTTYVDKTRFYVVFKMTDAYGSPFLKRSRQLSVSLSAGTASVVSGLSCQNGTQIGNPSTGSQYLYYCQGDARSTQFSSVALTEVSLSMTATFPGQPTYTLPLGGADAALNKLTLARTPAL